MTTGQVVSGILTKIRYTFCIFRNYSAHILLSAAGHSLLKLAATEPCSKSYLDAKKCRFCRSKKL